MDLIAEGIRKAFILLFTLDAEVLSITLLSLAVSGAATLISLFLGVSLGFAIALSEFRGKKFVISTINTGMGLPPVVVGLFVSIFLWRNGPFGFLGILYTPLAMVIAQTIIAAPLVMGITVASIQHLPRNLRYQILALGATRLQMMRLLRPGSAAAAACRGDGRVRRRDLRSRRLDHGGRQHKRLHAGAHHRNGYGDQPRQL